MLLAPALAHPWAQLAHAGPLTPVLDSAGGTGEAYPGAAYLPVTDIAFFFNVGHLKIFIESVAILLLFDVFWPRGMWDLSALTTD